MNNPQFRVWDNETNKFIYFNLFSNIESTTTEPSGNILRIPYSSNNDNLLDQTFYLTQQHKIEAATTLTDKNNTPIYEGDIIQLTKKRNYWQENGSRYTIQFGTFNFCGFGFTTNGEQINHALTKKLSENCIVVGNIHENN